MGEATRIAVDVADRDAFSGGDGENQQIQPSDGNQNDFEFAPNLNTDADSFFRFLQSNNESNFGRRSGPIDTGPVPLIPLLPEPIHVEPPPQPEPVLISSYRAKHAQALLSRLSLLECCIPNSSLIKNKFVEVSRVADFGSTFNDRITLEFLDGLSLKMSNVDMNNVKFEVFVTGGSVTATSPSPLGHTIMAERFVEGLHASNVALGFNFGDGIIINDALDVVENETVLILAGSSGSVTLTMDDSTAVGALIFGNGGNDSINLTRVSTDYILFGGIGSDTVKYEEIAGSVLMNFNNGGASVFHVESSDSFNSIGAVIGEKNQDFIKLKGTDSSSVYQSVIGGAVRDKFLANGSAPSSATLDGGSGNEDCVFTMVPASPFHIRGFTTTKRQERLRAREFQRLCERLWRARCRYLRLRGRRRRT